MIEASQSQPFDRVRRSKHRLKKIVCAERGAALVEFALLLPILVVLLSGLFQFGAIMYLQNNMSNVARDVSRRVAIQDLTIAQGIQRANDTLINWGVNFTINVTLPDPADPNDRDVVVMIAAPIAEAAIFDVFGVLASGNLRAVSVHLMES